MNEKYYDTVREDDLYFVRRIKDNSLLYAYTFLQQAHKEAERLNELEGLRTALADRDDTIAEMREQIQRLCNGLSWNIENHPEIMNGSDTDELTSALAILAKYPQKGK